MGRIVLFFLFITLIFPDLSSGESLTEVMELNQKGMELFKAGRYTEAEVYYKKALKIWEKILGKEHPDVAIGLDALAGLYYKTERYTEAEPLYKRALEIREKALGKDHIDVALSLSYLAQLYYERGRYSDAEVLYKKALDIRERIWGKEHSDLSVNLTNLGILYEITDRYSEAEVLYKRVLEIKEKRLGKNHSDIDVAQSLNSLAILYINTGRQAEAVLLFKRVLEIAKKASHKDPLFLPTILINVAGVYKDAGLYSEAEPLYKRSLEILERTAGEKHPLTASALGNLAGLYSEAGRYSEAESLYKRALEMWEKALGKDHSLVARSLNNLALLYAVIDKHPESHRLFTRAIDIEDKKREDVFLLLSEKQKLNYIEQTKGNIQGFITHSTYYQKDDLSAVTDTLNTWFRWKSAVMEAQGRFIDALHQSDNPEIKKKFDDLTGIRREFAKLQLSGSGKMTPEEYQKRIKGLEEKKESLEAELSSLSRDFALEKMVGRVDVKRISEILPEESVYIDFANISLYDFKGKRWGKSRYLVFVLIPAKEPVVKLIDIADTEDIDSHIKAYLEEMRRPTIYGELPKMGILKKEAKLLYEVVIKPVEKYIKGKKTLFISPDGNLNLIPFEVLMTPDGRYLIEDYLINYISAGRDIIRFTDTTTAKGDVIIIADPDYDMGLKERDKMTERLKVAKIIRGGVSRDASNLSFDRLPETKQEADDIEKVLKKRFKVKNYQDRSAIEEVIFSSETPTILHLATHGYFLKDEEMKGGSDIRGVTIKLKEGFAMDEGINPVLSEAEGIENPMLRSGIVFSGVNTSLKTGRDEGMVSAEKILGLNLKGTDLVVLSACETGVGDVKNGEGVFGLKKAFMLSGAKTLVMSLWSVPSAETTEIMTEFYTLMAEGNTKSGALRQARLNMMEKSPNPFYWGAFVMVGKPE
ncbi:MAG: hypothetical protein A3J72_06150 [Nitrospirae bacterium RIFCSPHIGHO2_02_FULL_40_19]|nr:MAG: hypothetical protein A3J72_06150 [Nitrospirae bacterium RIFCSPHIGHO2_02_FULL_40_19]